MQHHVTSCCKIVSVLYITEALCQRIPKHQKGLGEKSGARPTGDHASSGRMKSMDPTHSPVMTTRWVTVMAHIHSLTETQKKTATRFTEEPLCLNECEPLHATHSDESGAMFIDFIDCRNATVFLGNVRVM